MAAGLPEAADGGTPADEHSRYPRPFLGCRAARLSVDRGGIAVRSQLPPRGLSARLGRGAGETDGVRRMRCAPALLGCGSRMGGRARSEEHTSELQSLMRISYAVFCLKKKNINKTGETVKRTYTET